MSKLTLDSFGEIIDGFLKENEIQMLLTMPEGSDDLQIMDNTGMGCVVQFYILLNAIKPIIADLQKQGGIDPKSSEWEKVVDTLLGMVKREVMDATIHDKEK